MKVEIIKSLTDNFKFFAKQTEIEFWLAKDLQHLLDMKEEKEEYYESIL